MIAVLASVVVCLIRDAIDHLNTDPSYEVVARATKLIESSGAGTEVPVMANTSYVWVLLDVHSTMEGSRILDFDRETLTAAPPGTLIVWTGEPGSPDAVIPLSELVPPRYVEIGGFETIVYGYAIDREPSPFHARVFEVRSEK